MLQSRNKVEDGAVMPVPISTTLMLAGIGTKSLPDNQLCFLRDQMNGYGLVKSRHPSYELPSFIVDGSDEK